MPNRPPGPVTNQLMQAPKPSATERQPGIVIRSTGSSVRVRTQDGELVDCVVRGKFRIQGLKTTNPVAVGDRVHITPPQQESELGVVVDIAPRKNYILRKAIGMPHKVHILCANVDQAILMFTLEQPETSLGFANRFLVTAEAYHIPAVVVFNKVDLLTQPEQQARLQEVVNLYEGIGYHTLCVNSHDEAYRETVMELLTDKLSFIGGHSGAGKSTLINLVDPELDIKTAQVSGYSQKGRHTTTYAEMHPLAGGGYIIDSPGIKELGLVSFERQDLSHYFPEMRARLMECKFNDCTHTKEPKCAIKEALEAGEIHESRYQSYLRMLEEVSEEKGY